MRNKKIIVLDTSVLLYDKNCIFNFKENDVYIPLTVLEELDRFKDRSGILGENARYINRQLDDLRKLGSLSKGIDIEDKKIHLKIWSTLNSLKEIDISLNMKSNDNIIISAIIDIKNKYKESRVVFVTKDINLRVKCDALGIESNDYYADYEFIETEKIYNGVDSIVCDSDIINIIYSSNKINTQRFDIKGTENLQENQFVILSSENKQSVLCYYQNKFLIKLPTKEEIYKNCRIEPKNKEQQFALWTLLNEEISLITMTGTPGSGKTYLTLMSALSLIEKNIKNRIIFTRPIQTVGKDIGFLPGDVNEKMAPWLAPIVDNFRNQFGDLSYFDLMMEKGQIDIAPLSYIRGRSFNDSIIIVDEAQNATIHELKTVITRTGKNSKIILLGDIEQVDIPYVDKFSNGLTIVIEKMKNERLTSHIHFEKGYRSELANVAAKLL